MVIPPATVRSTTATPTFWRHCLQVKQHRDRHALGRLSVAIFFLLQSDAVRVFKT